MAGLLGEDDDMQAILERLYGTKIKAHAFSAGPISGLLGEQSISNPSIPEQNLLPRKFADVGIGLPDYGRIGVRVEKDPNQGDTTISPSTQLKFGASPFSLHGGLDITQREARGEDPGTSTMRPHYGASANIPIGEGNAHLGVTITPEQAKTFIAQYRGQLGPAQIAALLQYVKPDNGPDDMRAGFRVRLPF